MTAIVSGKGRRVPLVYTGTVPAETKVACAASGAYTESNAGVIDVKQSRRLTLWCAADAVTSESSAQVSLLVLMATDRTIAGAEGAPPLTADDRWFAPGFFDGIPTNGNLTASSLGSLWGSATVSPNLARCLFRAGEIRLPVFSAATDKVRIAIDVDVSRARYVRILYAEAGDTAHPSELLAYYTLGTG